MAIRAGGRRPADYAKAPKERGFRRVVTIDLDDTRFNPVFEYAVSVNPDAAVQDTLRELLLQAMALDAANPAIRAWRMAAFVDARMRIHDATREFLGQLKRELVDEPAGSEDIGIQPGNYIATDALPDLFDEPFS